MRLGLSTFAFLITSVAMFGQACNASELDDLKQEVESLKAAIATLKAENRELRSERDALEKELKQANNAPNPKPANDLAPVNMSWKGKFGAVNGAKQSATMRVVTRGDKTATFRIEIEDGAVWDFDCTFTGNKFKIDNTTRVRANKALQAQAQAGELAAVGGVTGSGEVRAGNKTFTIKYDWAKPEGVRSLRFDGELK